MQRRSKVVDPPRVQIIYDSNARDARNPPTQHDNLFRVGRADVMSSGWSNAHLSNAANEEGHRGIIVLLRLCLKLFNRLPNQRGAFRRVRHRLTAERALLSIDQARCAVTSQENHPKIQF